MSAMEGMSYAAIHRIQQTAVIQWVGEATWGGRIWHVMRGKSYIGYIVHSYATDRWYVAPSPPVPQWQTKACESPAEACAFFGICTTPDHLTTR